MKKLYLATIDDRDEETDFNANLEYRLVSAESEEDAIEKLKKIFRMYATFEINKVIE